MNWVKRATPLAAISAIAVGGVAVPAAAKTAAKPAHWSARHCTAYKTSFLKRHTHPAKAQLAAANKVLKRHGCTIKA